MIRVGTSGYSYDDWHSRFYPADLAARDRLAFYARKFGCVEVNSTFYRQPTTALTAAMVAKVPPEFRFAVKVYGGITHDWTAATAGDFRVFAGGLKPLLESGRLGAVLAQFPHRFSPSRERVAHVRRLREEWPDLPLVVEFRHDGWLDERTFDLLEALSVGFCCVDEPAIAGLMPPLARVTASPAYVRFHGRNAAKWYDHEQAYERYDYLYSAAELAEWVPRIKTLALQAEETYVFFNNHYDAQAVVNATELSEQLGLL